MRLTLLGLGLLAFLAFPVSAQDTSWRNPTKDYGLFRYPERAYYDDNLYAYAYRNETHIYYGYMFDIPPEAEILGIEVRLDAWRWPAGEPFFAYIDVRLSGDEGRSWSAVYSAGSLTGSERTYVLGGATDLWGYPWRPEHFQPATFQVWLRIRTPRDPEVRLDWVAVRVYYSTGLSLEVEPQTVDLGTLTVADYDRGHRELLGAQTVRLTSSTTWTLSVAALSATWRYTGSLPDPKKPCAHLLWRVEYADGSVSGVEKEFVPLSPAERTVAKGTAGSAKLSLSFRLLVDYDTTWPGTYALDFRYTLTAP